MHILLERTGGFAGRTVKKEFDTGSMSARQTSDLDKLVRKSRFFDLPLKLESSTRGADICNYRLTIESEGRAHTVEASDTAVPPDMRTLLDWLMRL